MKGREDIGYKFRLRDKEGTVVGYAWFTKNNWWYQEHPEALWHLVKIPCYEMDLFSEHVDQDGKELYEGDECQFYEQVRVIRYENGSFFSKGKSNGQKYMIGLPKVLPCKLIDDAIHQA